MNTTVLLFIAALLIISPLELVKEKPWRSKDKKVRATFWASTIAAVLIFLWLLRSDRS